MTRLLHRLFVPAYLVRNARAETRRMAGYLASAREDIKRLRWAIGIWTRAFDLQQQDAQFQRDARVRLIHKLRAVRTERDALLSAARDHQLYANEPAESGEDTTSDAMERLRAANVVADSVTAGPDWAAIQAMDPWHFAISWHLGQWHVNARREQGSTTCRASAPTIAEALRTLREELER